jgi:[ribosomal protein S5]-alanine N-acetyltransferase
MQTPHNPINAALGTQSLHTERLLLRPFTEADAGAFLPLVSDPRVLRYTGETPAQSEAEALAILRARPLSDYQQHGFGRMACVLRESHELIGFCGLKKLVDLNEIDIGYRFRVETWGQGFASEAAQAVYAHGKTQLNLARIIGLVIAENIPSVRVLTKLGMQRETAIRVPGEPCDFDVYV